MNDFREKWAVSLSEIAQFRHKAGRSEEAFDAIRKSIEIFERLVAAQAEQPRYRAEVGPGPEYPGYLHDEFRENGGRYRRWRGPSGSRRRRWPTRRSPNIRM